MKDAKRIKIIDILLSGIYTDGAHHKDESLLDALDLIVEADDERADYDEARTYIEE